MFFKQSLSLVFTVFVFCEAAFVDHLAKCKINDGACGAKLIQSVIRDNAKTGVPELDIPPFDPVTLSNISVSISDLIDITLIEGSLKGIKDCVIDKFVINVEDGHAVLEQTCDISIKGQYKIFSSSPLIKNLFSQETITGSGSGKIKIEKLHLRYDFFLFVQRRNGELYIKCKLDEKSSQYDIKGNVVFFADNFFIGNQESSKLVTALFNENWRHLMTSYSKPFMDKAMKFVDDNLQKFFNSVPAKYYISDDLTPYVKDN